VGLLAFIFALFVISVALGFVLLKIDTVVKRTKSPPSVIIFAIVGVLAGGTLLWVYGSQIGGVASSAPGNLSRVFLRWDFLLFLILASFHLAANIDVISLGGDKIPPAIKDEEDQDFSKRKYRLDFFNYAATALKDTSSSYILAVSILIPASFVIVQVSRPTPGAQVSANVATALQFVFRGVVWFLFSLFCGIVSLYLVSMQGRHRDLTRWLPLAAFLGFQFYSLSIGVICLVTGLYYVVFL
jgi:hypothetical protein